jgi:hypothetical protein
MPLLVLPQVFWCQRIQETIQSSVHGGRTRQFGRKTLSGVLLWIVFVCASSLRPNVKCVCVCGCFFFF